MNENLKLAEEAKRERAYDRGERWKQIQETITWAEANMKPEFRRNRPRYRDAAGQVRFFEA
jgi:hypothetical protein